MQRGPDRVAVVTGANRGIGLEVVRQLAGRGYTVVLGSRDPKKGDAAAERLRARDEVLPWQLDVTSELDIERLRDEVEERFGSLDVLVNKSVLWAVELPDGGPTGGFFRDGRPVPW